MCILFSLQRENKYQWWGNKMNSLFHCLCWDVGGKKHVLENTDATVPTWARLPSCARIPSLRSVISYSTARALVQRRQNRTRCTLLLHPALQVVLHCSYSSVNLSSDLSPPQSVRTYERLRGSFYVVELLATSVLFRISPAPDIPPRFLRSLVDLIILSLATARLPRLWRYWDLNCDRQRWNAFLL